MNLPVYLTGIIWINIRVCLPFTFLFITLCCLVRLHHVPVSYYLNLLLSNLIQLIILIALPQVQYPDWRHVPSALIFSCCAMASLCFRLIIALERCFSISCPVSNRITQTKGFVIVSVLVWVFCIVFVSLFLLLPQVLSYLLFALLPAPVFVICLIWTLKSTHINIPVPADEKCGIVRILVALLIHYFVTIFPIVIRFMFFEKPRKFWDWIYLSENTHICVTLFLLSYFMDMILFLLLCKGFMDKLLKRLCCCMVGNPGENNSNKSPV